MWDTKMQIKPAGLSSGDALAKDLKLIVCTADRPLLRTTAELFGGKRCVIFGVPGAFEPKVSEEYLKGFLEKHRDLKGSGAELIACISVNDPYVVKQWAQARYVGDSVLMLADPQGTFTEVFSRACVYSCFCLQQSMCLLMLFVGLLACDLLCANAGAGLPQGSRRIHGQACRGLCLGSGPENGMRVRRE
jgi:hypothetical protein